MIFRPVGVRRRGCSMADLILNGAMARRLSGCVALLCLALAGVSCQSSSSAEGGAPPAPSSPVPPVTAISPAATPPAARPAANPPIREFDLATLARLGRELYRHDQLAWIATDALTAQVGKARLEAELTGGWIVDVSGPQPLVRFLRATATGVEAAYDVSFPPTGRPFVRVPAVRTLTSGQLVRRQAVQAAQQALIEGHFPLWKDPYNTVVLDDPAGRGFLVYYLRSKTAPEAIPVGGHYRITVSEDGRAARQVDRLFASFLTVDRSQLSNGGTMVAATMSHVISNTPLETHVFLSLQEHLPFYVITPDGRRWLVADGAIALTNAKSAGAEPAPSPP